MITPSITYRRGALCALLAFALLLAGSSSASAAVGPKWSIDSLSNTTIQPGTKTFLYSVQAKNVGDAPMGTSSIELNATLAPGMTVVSMYGFDQETFGEPQCTAGDGVSPVNGATTILCTNSFFPQPWGFQLYKIIVALAPDAQPGQTIESTFQVSGGAASPASAADPSIVSPSLPAFGVDAFDGAVSAPDQTPETRAASHPDSVSTYIDFNTIDSPHQPNVQGALFPVDPPRDVFVDLPPGFLGNLASVPTCTLAQLAHGVSVVPTPLCPAESQIGTTGLRYNNVFNVLLDTSVFNLAPPPGVPARFGFNFANTVVVFDAVVRSDSDYGVTVAARNISEGLTLAGSRVRLWGVPAEVKHQPERTCPGKSSSTGDTSCPSTALPLPILRNPTSCQEPLITSAYLDSWTEPAAQTPQRTPDLSNPRWKQAAFSSHEAPGYPLPPDKWGDEVGIEACDQVPFAPQITATPTTDAADSPSGLDVDLTVPQDCWLDVDSICQSDLKQAEVTLPEGMSLNPAAASGRTACSPAQIGLTTAVGSSPVHFDAQAAHCPDAAKIGDLEIETPLLGRRDNAGKPVLDAQGNVVPDPLKGAVYLASQSDNPFGSLLAIYLVAEGSGVVVKQAGEISVDPQTGRLTTSFGEVPEQPFSKLHLSLYGGPRAALRTPPTCGPYTTEAKLTPWARPAEDVLKTSTFEITNCPNSGFDPKLHAGTANPLAGAYSPFALRLTREDGTQELGAIRLGVPPGLLANLKGIPYCSDAALAAVSGALGTGAAQIANPSCPAASQVGTVTAGAGAGPTPFYSQTGKAYWAGPYKGAPVSLAAVVPAVAGPFDLGSVVVRNRFEVDPETAKITAVSDPLPSALHGIPLDLRDVRVNLDRPNYTLNPTSCDPMAFSSDITSTAGAHASPTERFQAGGCDRLAFKPKLSLALKGGTKRRGHPALRATLTMPEGGANIAKASVALPHAEFLDQSHIGTVCTRVQYAANQCPAKSVYGYARAYSPILDYYLQGPVYLRSSNHQLPDLVASLGGQIQIDVAGRIDTFKGGVRASFESVPDAPVSKFVLTMAGGKKGLIENSEDLCASPQRATALFDAQNAKSADFKPLLKVKCGAKAKKAGKKHGSGY